jgi:hypothetical protein
MKRLIAAAAILLSALSPAGAQRAPGDFASGTAYLVGGNFRGSLFVTIPNAVQIETGYRVEMWREPLSDSAPHSLLAAEPDCDARRIDWRLDRVVVEGRNIAFEGPADLGAGWTPFPILSGNEEQRLLGFLCGDAAARAAVVPLPRRLSTRMVARRFQGLLDAGLVPALISNLAVLEPEAALAAIDGLTESDLRAPRGSVNEVRERARAVFAAGRD